LALWVLPSGNSPSEARLGVGDPSCANRGELPQARSAEGVCLREWGNSPREARGRRKASASITPALPQAPTAIHTATCGTRIDPSAPAHVASATGISRRSNQEDPPWSIVPSTSAPLSDLAFARAHTVT